METRPWCGLGRLIFPALRWQVVQLTLCWKADSTAALWVTLPLPTVTPNLTLLNLRLVHVTLTDPGAPACPTDARSPTSRVSSLPQEHQLFATFALKFPITSKGRAFPSHLRCSFIRFAKVFEYQPRASTHAEHWNRGAAKTQPPTPYH